MRINREALIALRQLSGDSRETLAGRAGITREGLRKIEAGKVQRPRYQTLRNLADALSVPVGAITHPDGDTERVAS